MAKKAVDAGALDALVTTVATALGAHAALPAAELKVVKRHLAVLRPRLEALGFEVTPSNVRRPLEAQLLGALEAAENAWVPAKGIEKRVRGASAKETKAALAALVAGGRVREVVRSTGPGFMLASPANDAALLEQDALHDLLRRLTDAQRLVKRAVAKKGSRSRPAALRSDVLGPLLPQVRADAPATVGERIRARVEGSDRPLRIPDLLRALGVERAAGKRALVEGASAGMFGLEPESGMGRLSADDAEWCPTGPEGTRLSWVVPRVANRIA